MLAVEEVDAAVDGVRIDAGQAEQAADGDAKERERQVAHAVDEVHDLAGGVGVEAFIQPRLLELVAAHYAVPILVAEFVDDDLLGNAAVGTGPPGRAGGDESGVLHPARTATAVGRVHHRDRVVGVGAVPEAEPLQGAFRGTEVAVDLRTVLGLDEQDHAHGLEREFDWGDTQHFGGDVEFGRGDQARGVKLALHADEVRGGGPCEIVDVFPQQSKIFSVAVPNRLLQSLST